MGAALLTSTLAALYAVVAFLVRSVLVKFILFFGLWFLTTEFVAVLQEANVLPDASPLGNALINLPAGVWYWLDLFAFSAGTPLVISGYATRFVIRRLPIIG